MGNNSSTVKKSQKNSIQKVPANRQHETDDDDDDIDDDNVRLEVEVIECLEGESEIEVKNCLADKCESDHERYTPVEDLFGNIDENASLQILPEAIRHESVLEYIKIHEKLVVRIRTSVRGVTSKWSTFGTGCVSVSSDKLIKYDNCCLPKCRYNNGQVHKCYGGLIVYTNEHVILDHLEASCCNVDFFYYNEKSLIDVDVMTDGGSSWLENGAKISSLIEVDNSEQRDIGSSKLESGAKICSSTEVDSSEQRDDSSSRLYSSDNITSSGKVDSSEITNMDSCQLGSENDINSSGKVDNEITAAGGVQLLSGGCVNSMSEADKSEHDNGNDDEESDNNNNGHSGLYKGITAYGVSLREANKNKDLVGLRIFYHDPELFTMIKTLSNLSTEAWSKIPEEIKRKMKKFAIIISHPHGWPKKISFGDLISLEETRRNQKNAKETTYNAMTCGGSSGAPVITGHYESRPFVHKGKHQKKKFGVSHSF